MLGRLEWSVAVDREPMDPTLATEWDGRNGQANHWTLRGMALLKENTAASLEEALGCFAKAIELRRDLPLAQNPWVRYGLTAGWMNRGDALTRLGLAAQLAEAVQCYDEALMHLRDLPPDRHPLFRKRHAIAWMNRGLTLQQQGTRMSRTEAIQSFDQALAVLARTSEVEDPEFPSLHACVWMNRGNTLLDQVQLSEEQAGPAAQAGREALELVRGREEENVLTAEVGFKARHVLCRALALQLAGAELSAVEAKTRVAEATDAVEEGLQLARRWEQRGEHGLEDLVRDLFRFGARVYQVYQPHFLSEFVWDNLDPAQAPETWSKNSEMQGAGLEALWHGLRDWQREGFSSLHTAEFEPKLARLREWRKTEEALRRLARGPKNQ